MTRYIANGKELVELVGEYYIGALLFVCTVNFARYYSKWHALPSANEFRVLHAGFHFYNAGRAFKPANMGHCWSREVPHSYNSIL